MQLRVKLRSVSPFFSHGIILAFFLKICLLSHLWSLSAVNHDNYFGSTCGSLPPAPLQNTGRVVLLHQLPTHRIDLRLEDYLSIYCRSCSKIRTFGDLLIHVLLCSQMSAWLSIEAFAGHLFRHVRPALMVTKCWSHHELISSTHPWSHYGHLSQILLSNIKSSGGGKG